MPGFLEDWESFGLGDDDLHALQVCIMCDPMMASEIEGAGGLREGFFSPITWTDGRQVTVRYVYMEETSNVLLVVAYDGQEELPECERRMIRSFIQVQRDQLARCQSSMEA